MKHIIFLIISFEIYTSEAIGILYVSPDNTSCPSQPCATFSQYFGSKLQPIVSNVEYHFLPGEHHVPANVILQNLYNFSIIGISNSSSPVVLVSSSQSCVINIINSRFVMIYNVVLKQQNTLIDMKSRLTNLKLLCCFSCQLQNITLLQFGFIVVNLIGESYINNIKIEITHSSKLCCQEISIKYTTCSSWNIQSSNMHKISINQLVIDNSMKCISNAGIRNIGLYIDLHSSLYHLQVLLSNSDFYNMYRTALTIEGKCSSTAKKIFITNCTFILNDANPIINIFLSPVNQIISFINCKFYNNINNLFAISVNVPPNNLGCRLVNINNTYPLIAININFIRCQFNNNKQNLFIIKNLVTTFNGVYVLFESSNFLDNANPYDMIAASNVNICINGPVNVIKNHARSSIIHLHSCDILLSGTIRLDKNYRGQVVTLDTYIKVMEHGNITFFNNQYQNTLIAVESTEKHNQPYPFCIFQYVVNNSSTTATIDLRMLTHYVITFNDNYKILPRQNTQNINCSRHVSFCHFTSHCKWLASAAFNQYSPEAISKQIIQNDDQNCRYHKHLCYCFQSENINCSVDTLGTVYPGQTLQANLCNTCDHKITVLRAEVHNINLPNSSCKIAHQSQLVNFIGNHSNTVNFTIVSSAPDNDRCELFLTAAPFLNKVYDVFYVQLLPCPVGFTLQNGICGCDPILPLSRCYIDQSTIRRPPNTWIAGYNNTNDTKYLISDCPMDYCLQYSSNINLLHPDSQCQFNRTGILCSQCQHHHLSMVFGSSRCIKCTNIHILITIIVIVTGILLVVLLYLLNFTVTKGTINGIIFYANIVSINDSVFLVNDNVFKPLRVFISFVNLDLGIETCFYNGMDSYAKMWLQLFFPIYLIIISVLIIIASRYSSRILRLTYTRSLPVLATLFLLSYTGVLRTVLTVLFSYSTITYLPSGHQQTVWSIDASVPLFGLKFTILFITCLVLFLLLVPFNVSLLLTRYLLRFRIINRFKPFLDAFQGSYKDKYYYWVAANIILRSMIFSLYGFQTKLRLILTTMILVIFTVYHGYIHPNKNKMVNIQELLLLINLIIMYAVSYQGSESVFSTVTNVMISLAFIQFCTIVLYHFLTYTCHCDVVNMLQTGKQKMIKYMCYSKRNKYQVQNLELLNIPECTYNYTEFQDGLVSDDFKYS